MAKWRAIEDLSVGHAVEGASARKGDVFERNALMQLIQQMEEYLLELMLESERQIHVTLRDFRVRLARLAKQFLHAIGEMTCEFDSAVGQDLHSLIAAQRFEVAEI